MACIRLVRSEDPYDDDATAATADDDKDDDDDGFMGDYGYMGHGIRIPGDAKKAIDDRLGEEFDEFDDDPQHPLQIGPTGLLQEAKRRHRPASHSTMVLAPTASGHPNLSTIASGKLTTFFFLLCGTNPELNKQCHGQHGSGRDFIGHQKFHRRLCQRVRRRQYAERHQRHGGRRSG